MRTARATDRETFPLPTRQTTIPIGRRFSADDMSRIRDGLVPEQMEDKWFIYWQDASLYLHRSWTGFCVYVARFQEQDGEWTLVEVDVNRDPDQYSQTSDEADAEMIQFLIDSLLLGRDAEFPTGSLSPDQAALEQWSQVGRAMLGQHPGDDQENATRETAARENADRENADRNLRGLPPVIQTLADLVRINSVNPAYGDGGSELPVVEYIREFFASRRLEVWQQEVFPGRPNLIVRLPGRDPSRRVILEAHTDTVSIRGMTIPPFEPRIEGDLLYGRGSCDTKAGLAGMMHAVASLHDEGIVPPCEVWLAAVVDEEFSFRGVTSLCEGLEAQAAIVAEPTQLRAVVASKGVLRWKLNVHGKAAHSSKPHLGVNAIHHMAQLVLALEEYHRELAAHAHPLLGPATSNVGVIRGGVQVNFVPDECEIEVDRRLLPGERVEDVLRDYQQRIDELHSADPDFEATMQSPMLVDEALDTDPTGPAAVLAGQILSRMGLDPTPAGVPFGSDASKLARQGVASLIFGPGSIDRAHAAVEYVEIDQVILAADFYRDFIRLYGSE